MNINNWISINSSFIHSVRYSAQTRQLDMVLSTKIYHYYEVPNAIYQGLIIAYSKGAYYNKYIKGRYGEEHEQKKGVPSTTNKKQQTRKELPATNENSKRILTEKISSGAKYLREATIADAKSRLVSETIELGAIVLTTALAIAAPELAILKFLPKVASVAESTMGAKLGGILFEAGYSAEQVANGFKFADTLSSILKLYSKVNMAIDAARVGKKILSDEETVKIKSVDKYGNVKYITARRKVTADEKIQALAGFATNQLIIYGIGKAINFASQPYIAGSKISVYKKGPWYKPKSYTVDLNRRFPTNPVAVSRATKAGLSIAPYTQSTQRLFPRPKLIPRVSSTSMVPVSQVRTTIDLENIPGTNIWKKKGQ